MDSDIIVALITGICSLCGCFGGAYLSQSKTLYRIDQLEKKQDKHNSVIERTYAIEKSIGVIDEQIKVANHRIDDLEKSALDNSHKASVGFGG